jgi:hypothetical protein
MVAALLIAIVAIAHAKLLELNCFIYDSTSKASYNFKKLNLTSELSVDQNTTVIYSVCGKYALDKIKNINISTYGNWEPYNNTALAFSFDANTEYKTQLHIIFQCEVPTQLVRSEVKNGISHIYAVYNQPICPDYTANALSQFLITNKIPFALVFIVLGLYFMSFGFKYIKITIYLLPLSFISIALFVHWLLGHHHTVYHDTNFL